MLSFKDNNIFRIKNVENEGENSILRKTKCESWK